MNQSLRPIALAAILACTTTTAYATADGPDFWRVWNVAADDVLNVRVGPGANYPKITSIEHDADRLKVIVCVPTTTRNQWFQLSQSMQEKLAAMSAWCLIQRHSEQLGWVNRRYLTEDDEY